MSRVDPDTGEVVATIAIDPTPGSIETIDPVGSGPATGGGHVLAKDDAVWVFDEGGFAWKIDPATNDIAARVELSGLHADSGIAFAEGRLSALGETGWMQFDESTHAVSGPFVAPPELQFEFGLTASPGAVWLGSTAGVARVNPGTGAVDAVVDVGPEGPSVQPIGFASDLVWAIGSDTVWAIDPATNEVARSLDKPAEVESLRPESSTITDEAIWVVGGPAHRMGSYPDLRQQLVRFDLETGDVTSVDLVSAEFGFIMGLTSDEESVWAADFARGNLLKVDVDP